MSEGPELHSSGGHDDDRPIYMDFLERNEAGFLPMEWQGTVWCIKALGDNLIVYGDNGISLLYMIDDPYPTFGMRTLRRFGIAGRTAVGGGDSGHIFIDAAGKCWSLSPELEFTELDFDEVLADLVTDHISIIHDPQLDEFHITGTDGSTVKAFTLSDGALYRHKHAPTSGEFISGSMVGVYEELSSFDYAEVRTDTIDFGSRDIKTIQSIEVGGTATSTLSCRIFFRSDSSNGWSYTARTALNEKGVLDILASGVEFQIQIYDEDYTNVSRIDYIKIVWRSSGVRNFKGSVS